MPSAQILFKPLALFPAAAVRRALSKPVGKLIGTHGDVKTLGEAVLMPGQRFEARLLRGSIQINPTGAMLWQGKWIEHPYTSSKTPDLLVHYFSRRKPIPPAVMLSYTPPESNDAVEQLLSQIEYLRQTPLNNRVVLVGVDVAKHAKFRRAMASGHFFPLEFAIHREDTRLDCEDLLLPSWPTEMLVSN
jgi:hypothetical protein